MNGPVLLLACLLLTSAASYLLKLGATGSGTDAGLLGVAMHPLTILGAACYAATFALYALALQKVPLSLAQPVITGGATVVTALVSVVVLRESMGATNWLGLLLVCSGIYLLFWGRV